MQNCLKKRNEILISGTIIYFIGNVLTQIISIVLLKYITGAVSTEEYGYFSLVVTVDNLITPMVTLQISDAVFRFFVRAKTIDDEKTIYSSGTTVILSGVIVMCILIAISKNIVGINYPFWVALYVISTNLFGYIQKVTRSLGKNRIYVAANLIKSALYFLFILLFVLKNNMGVVGLLISNCMSTYICIFILAIRIKTYQYFSIHSISFRCTKEMLKFSAPLIPNTAIWWMQSSINSLLLTTQMGLAYNGIYAVAIKFASVLHLVINVFDLAWQESAIREYGSEDYKTFITQTFNKYLIFLLSCVAVLIPFLRIFMPLFIDSSYYEAIPYIPFLLCSTALSACSGFFAQIITAKNQNIKLLTTNLIGAVSNIVIVLGLIKLIGIWAIVLSSLVSTAILVFSRYSKVREDFELENICKRKIMVLFIANLISCAVFLIGSNIILVITMLIMMLFSIYANWDLMKEIFTLFEEKFFMK